MEARRLGRLGNDSRCTTSRNVARPPVICGPCLGLGAFHQAPDMASTGERAEFDEKWAQLHHFVRSLSHASFEFESGWHDVGTAPPHPCIWKHACRMAAMEGWCCDFLHKQRVCAGCWAVKLVCSHGWPDVAHGQTVYMLYSQPGWRVPSSRVRAVG